jgi:DNA-binding transcriptional MerR regulator
MAETMKYTISEAAEKVNLTAHTLRYYDKEGLLPFVDRTDTGIRSFSDSDLESLELINCLKATGMPIKDIKRFMDWCVEGDSRLEERYQLFLERKESVLKQIAELLEALERIEYKCWYYKTAIEAGTTDIHKCDKTNHLKKRKEL